ncbi:hypothetical protein QQF64_009822 [Cirrhinus molitorella]|uniref:Uncharacterized protein n=1 Tax=Cirrhinus molitorella TaxID=172907 RepID=A0ABR3M326_9TELE
MKSNCSLVVLAQRRSRVSRLAKSPDAFLSHTGPLFSLLGAQRGDGKGGRGLHITLATLRALQGNMQSELTRCLSTELLEFMW